MHTLLLSLNTLSQYTFVDISYYEEQQATELPYRPEAQLSFPRSHSGQGQALQPAGRSTWQRTGGPHFPDGETEAPS